jgi:outer membrane protein OmpA-like peptidoglycan-associated protein
VIGVRPTGLPIGIYEYDISLKVRQAAFFFGGGRGTLTVKQVKPTEWPKPVQLRVWFATVGASWKLGTDSFSGRGSAAIPWVERDFIGRLERVKGGVGISLPGVSVGPSAGFLNIYGSEALPPMTVVNAEFADFSFGIEKGPGLTFGPQRWKLEASLGVDGLMGWTRPQGSVTVRDVTTVHPATLYGAAAADQRAVHFCFDSALLPPVARQNLRVAAALWRPFLADPRSTMVIVGHADRAGGDPYNRTLSLNRARNTWRALQDIVGADFAAVVSIQGRGESEATAGGVRAGAPDRRVEVQLNWLTIVTLNGG